MAAAGPHLWRLMRIEWELPQLVGVKRAISALEPNAHSSRYPVPKGDISMAKKRKRKTKSRPASLIDTSGLKSFIDSPTGRQLMADIVLAAAGVAAAALLASNRCGKAMGKAAMLTAQNAVMNVVATAMKR